MVITNQDPTEYAKKMVVRSPRRETSQARDGVPHNAAQPVSKSLTNEEKRGVIMDGENDMSFQLLT